MATSTHSVHQAPPRLPTIKQTALELNCSMRSAWRLLRSGELKSVKIGRATRITRESIEAFIEKGGAR